MRSNRGESSRKLTLSCSPLSFLRSDLLPSCVTFHPASVEEPRGLAQVLAPVLRRVVHRIGVFRREDLGRQLVAQRLEKLQLLWRGKPLCFHFGVVEVTARALVLAVEEIGVRPFEVERIVQGLADAHVLELRPADVHGPGLHALDLLQRDLFLDHAPVLDRRKVVAGGPALRGVLQPPVILIAGEGLEGHIGIAEVDVFDLVEIVLADIDRQILGPSSRRRASS